MGLDSNIGWTDHTWNPWRGCTKVSPGCKNCYMFAGQERWGRDPRTVTRASQSTFNAPLSPKFKPGDKVFTCSWSDFFIEDADEWRGDAWQIIRRRDDLVFQILTKRPERTERDLPYSLYPDDRNPNYHIGVSAETQVELDNRWGCESIDWISAEPLLGPLDLSWLNQRPEWVVVGGESGPGHRPCEVEWITGIVDQCKDLGIACFVKQDSGPRAGMQGRIPDDYWAVKEFPESMLFGATQ